MSGKLVVITGVTGNQGGSVAQSFLDAGWKVRGITRDTTKPSCKTQTDKGIELVAADFDHPDKLKAAFTGANVIFANTDYWTPMKEPALHQKAAETGRPVTEFVQERETQQGKNVIEAAATAIDTLDLFILSTLSDAIKFSKGKYYRTHHFNAKAAQARYLFDTPEFAELAKKTSLIQMPLFINNWKPDGNEFLIPKKQPDGTYLLRIPISPERSVPQGDPVKLCGPFALALTKVPPGKNLVTMSGWLNFVEWCEKAGKKNGITIKFEEGTREEVVEAIPGGIGDELADMFLYFRDFGYDGGDPTVIYPDKLGVDVKVETVDDYFEREDWSKLMNQ